MHIVPIIIILYQTNIY